MNNNKPNFRGMIGRAACCGSCHYYTNEHCNNSTNTLNIINYIKAAKKFEEIEFYSMKKTRAKFMKCLPTDACREYKSR